jgi:hypothetical protein
MRTSNGLRRALVTLAVVALVLTGLAAAALAADSPGTTTNNGITREALGEASPANAPG